MHWDGFGFGFGLMWIFWLVIAVVVVWAAVRFLGTSSRGPAGGSESAEDVLKKRYARGEISKEEYEQILRDLRR
jgi:putative membrane protein